MPVASAALQFVLQHLVEMAHVVEAGCVVGNGELLDARHVVRILNGDGRVIAKDMQKGDGVIAHLAGARIENLDDALNAFASAQGHRDHGAHHAPVRGQRLLQARIVIFRLGNDQSFAMLEHPARNAFAELHAQIAQSAPRHSAKRWRSRAPCAIHPASAASTYRPR